MNEDEQPQGGSQDPLAEFLKTPAEDPAETYARALWGDPEEQTNKAPQGLWQRLTRTAEGKSRVGEIARSAVRGVADFGIDVQDTLNDAADAVGLDSMAARGREGTAHDRQSLDEDFGARSGDAIASFAENAAEFAMGYAATAPLGVGKAVAGLGKVGAHIAEGAIRGAVSDFIADPNGEQLAELAARAPVPVVKQLGEMLSVDGDDSQIEKRLKRTAAGMVAGVALDGMIAGARRLRALKAGNVEEVAKQEKVLTDIAEGTHTPEGAAVVARPNEDGTWSLKAVEDEAKGLDTPEAVKFKDRAEAEAQAETINVAVKERISGKGGLTTEQADAVREGVRKLMTTNSNDEIQAILTDGTHFNLAYYTQTPDETKALIETVSNVFKEEMDAAEAHTTVEKVFQKAQRILGGMTEEQAAGIMKESIAKGGIEGTSARRLAADMVLRNLGEKIGRMHEILDNRPHDLIAHEEARLALDNFFGLQKVLAGADSEYGRALRFLQERDTFAKAMDGKNIFKSEAKAAEEAAAKEAAKAAKETFTAGMKHRDIKELTRLIQMADGKPRDLFAAGHAAKIIKTTGFIPKAVEFFVNSLLSGPKTLTTALIGNTSTSLYEGFSRALAGAATGNGGLAREGADMLWSHAAYLKDNFRTAVEAFRRGSSVINPGEIHHAIDGKLGDAVRLPSRGLLMADEFTRVSNYRAYVRAKSLRYWRDKGLAGSQLVGAVENDLRSAFKDGIATIPDALKFAEVPTLSSPLGQQSIGGSISSLINKHPSLKFIAPFVKTGINIFRYTWQMTPGLNMLQKDARETILAGARKGASQAEREAAAVLHTKSALATSMYMFGAYQVMSGNLTGRGPSDPKQRQLWLEDHQPYSMKMGGKWVSFRRMEPLSVPLGMVADLIEAGSEIQDDKDESAVDAGVAVVAALTANFSNKSYMVGLTKFFDAWSAGDPWSAQQWAGSFASGMLVPQAVQQTTTDPYFRDAQSVVEQVVARSPWSGNVSPKYNIYGEPVMRAKGYLNRSFNIATVADAKPDLTSESLAALEKSFSLPARNRVMGVEVNLMDREKFNNGSGVSPWDRMMELMREPKHGRESLRSKLAELVQSDKWANASAGSELFPGGKRWAMANAIVDRYQSRALGQVLKEYPLLKEEVKNQKKLKGASFRNGQAGVNELLQKLSQ